MSGSVSGISSSMGNYGPFGGPGEAKSIVEGTLSESNKMAAWYKAPVKIPDTNKMFPLGSQLNLSI
ncbi:MAG: hypothetical protein WCX65_09300 [bacterium]